MKHMNTILTALATPLAVAPTSPDNGDEWIDSRTGEKLVWDGTYWKVGDLVRVETLVDVDTAAADHDIGWDVPAGFDVIKTSCRILKTLTGAAGAVKMGFGTKAAGDPDKYALPGALTANQTAQNVNGTWNDGGGDDLGLTGCDNAGLASGTLAGSNDADVRVMVWMRPLITLP